MALPRWFLNIVKNGLALFGAYLLVSLYLERWGGPATIWFLGAPLVYGLWRGLTAFRAPTSTPAPR